MILTLAEARVALGLTGNISQGDQALLDMLMPMVKGAIMDDPNYGLMYDPEETSSRIEYYPRIDPGSAASPREGVWDTNLAGTKAYFQEYGRNDVLQLKHLPVREVNEIKVDFQGGFGQIADTFSNDTIWIAGEHYYQDLESVGLNLTGHIFSRTGWPIQPGAVKVTYKSGYTADELGGRASTINASGIKHAFLLTLVKAFRTFKTAGKQGMAGFVSGPITSERLGDYSWSGDAAAARALTGMEISVPSEAGDKLQPFRHYGLMVI